MCECTEHRKNLAAEYIDIQSSFGNAAPNIDPFVQKILQTKAEIIPIRYLMLAHLKAKL